MIFSGRFLVILFRVMLIAGLALGLSYTYLRTDLLVTPVMFGILMLLTTMELVWTLQKQERSWVRFLQSVKYQDFNRVYQKQSSRELTEAYELITQSMEELQSSKEAEFRLLQTVLGHISVGVACYTSEGDVKFTNAAFDDLLGLKGLIHVDKLSRDHPQIHQVMTTSDAVPTEWVDHENGKKLFIRTERFKLKGTNLTLVSITDIRSSLDAKEIESYQRLMRVMTHEIMNSATPILSLIQVVNRKLIEKKELRRLEKKDQKNIAMSLLAVEERTAGILRFVDAYKKINRPIKAKLQPVQSKDLLQEVGTLMGKYLQSVKFTVKDEIKSALMIDRALIGQVLINLTKNAIEAVNEKANGEVKVNLAREGDALTIVVSDNGPGVKPEDVHHIFVPFFTTKPEGSGVGLALSRKIIKAHGGTLSYSRLKGKTMFNINLPEHS